MIIITQVAYVMARAYRYCLLISKQCTCGLVRPKNSCDFLDRIKRCSIPEIFLYCVETKEYCEQNENLEKFFTKMRLLENFW